VHHDVEILGRILLHDLRDVGSDGSVCAAAILAPTVHLGVTLLVDVQVGWVHVTNEVGCGRVDVTDGQVFGVNRLLELGHHVHGKTADGVDLQGKRLVKIVHDGFPYLLGLVLETTLVTFLGFTGLGLGASELASQAIAESFNAFFLAGLQVTQTTCQCDMRDKFFDFFQLARKNALKLSAIAWLASSLAPKPRPVKPRNVTSVVSRTNPSK
jgi:hypothetical protein